jgi:hypothetical protein
VRTYAQRGLRRLLHHVAELTRELHLAGAMHARGLDEEDLAAHAVHARPVATPGLLGALGHLAGELLRAEVRPQVVDVVDLVGADVALGDLHRDAADHRRDLALEAADAGLAGVVLDDLLEALSVISSCAS